MNTRHNTCQRATGSLLNDLFSQCFQSLLSICQTLPSRELTKLGHNRISLFACPNHSLSFQTTFLGFQSENPHFAIKSPFWVFNFFFGHAKVALSGFQLWQVIFLVGSSIVFLDYVDIDRTGELFSIHSCEYQSSFGERLFHDIKPFPVE